MHQSNSLPRLSTATATDHVRNGLIYQPIKRSIDIIFACGLLILFSVPMMVIALAVKWTSPGPILFQQERIGKDGRPFFMLKFRSMGVQCDHNIHRVHALRLISENISPADLGTASLKIKDDPRVTAVGKVIRALSLDELPQLLNVLRGEMSLVGPRPPVPYEYELYDAHARQRCHAMPGITGFWQVTARNQVSFAEMIELDLTYIATMSLWLDLKIMALTPLEMLRGKGAR